MSVVVHVLQCAAALLHKWPLGLIRVNLFVLPLIYFLTVAGISAAYTALRRPGAVRAASAVVLAAGLAVLGFAGVAQARDVAVLHHAALRYRWEQQLDTVVMDARRLESPGTRFVVLLDGTTTGCLDEPPGAPHGLGWRFYMKLDAGTGHDIPSRDTYFVTTARASAAHLVPWLRASSRPPAPCRVPAAWRDARLPAAGRLSRATDPPCRLQPGRKPRPGSTREG